MTPRPAVPAPYPLALPESSQPLPPTVTDTAAAFSRAVRAYHHGDLDDARNRFLAVARVLLAASGPDLPDLSGARTVCYFNAVLAGLTAEGTAAVGEVLRWVADEDPICSDTVAELVDRLVPGARG